MGEGKRVASVILFTFTFRGCQKSQNLLFMAKIALSKKYGGYNIYKIQQFTPKTVLTFTKRPSPHTHTAWAVIGKLA